MPKRWIETDEDRLPEGMTRVGYDADEQRYTFRDAQGLWIGEEGNEYGGRLTYAGPGENHLTTKWSPMPGLNLCYVQPRLGCLKANPALAVNAQHMLHWPLSFSSFACTLH